MHVGLDGVGLGPLNLGWASLTLAVGLVTWFSLARFPRAEGAAIITLVVARLWAAIPGLATQRPVLDNLLDIVDIRRGNWAWIPGLAAGAAYLFFFVLKRNIPARHVTSSLLITLLLAALPQLLKPAPQGAQVSLPQTPLPSFVQAKLKQPTPLPHSSVVNFWATWCGPCRAELPLLARRMARGEPIALVNVGETPPTISSFLSSHDLAVNTWLRGEAIGAPLSITAFPTTLAVDAQGRIVARHLGPLSGAQLNQLLTLARGNP